MCAVLGAKGKIGGWGPDPSVQYHIQTDEGPERYFKYQTVSGQYRKEKRLQDGSVVGSYGWVDADGYLRLRDYVADEKGYRIIRSRTIKVGQGTPIDRVVAAVKKPDSGAVRTWPVAAVDSATPIAVTAAPPIAVVSRPPPVAAVPNSTGRPLPPISLSDYLKEQATSTPAPVPEYVGRPSVDITPNAYPPTSTPSPELYVPPVTFRPYFNLNAIDSDPPRYDGVAITNNGFRYYLPRHYHEEQTLGQSRAGSFGYIDPFGIRRVIYYNSSPGSGFVHRKNNGYVGFNSTPYDPRF